MRLSRTVFLFIAAALFFAAPQAQSNDSVVTVDVVAKTSTGSVDTIDPKGLKFQGDQVGMLLRSLIFTPQTFTLKTKGLKDQNYDVYIDQAFKYTKSAKELENGIELLLSGRTADESKIKCLQEALPNIKDTNKRFSKSSDPEAKRISFTLSQATTWASTSTNREQRQRSVSVIIAPTGIRLQKMSIPAKDDPEKVKEGLSRACSLLQQARSRMFQAIKNPILRNDAVVAMTPVEFTTSYSMVNGKPRIEASLLNNCDLSLSGVISISLPEGWNTTTPTAEIKDLAAGKTHKVTFDLTSKAKDAAAPEKISLAANLKVVQDRFRAEMSLNSSAKAPAK